MILYKTDTGLIPYDKESIAFWESLKRQDIREYYPQKVKNPLLLRKLNKMIHIAFDSQDEYKLRTSFKVALYRSIGYNGNPGNMSYEDLRQLMRAVYDAIVDHYDNVLPEGFIETFI